VNRIVGAAAGVPGAAVSVVLCAIPGVRLRVAGFAVIPPRSPDILTDTVPLKELTAFTVTLTDEPAAPASMVNNDGDSVSV
jgi:hypothetical protein